MQKVEKLLGGASFLLAIAATALLVVEGLKNGHAAHIVLAVCCILAATLFFFIARLYLKDYLQDRKVVYLACALVIVLSCCGLLYATAWGDSSCPDIFAKASCEKGLLDKNGNCLDINITTSAGTCVQLSGHTNQYTASAVFSPKPTCTESVMAIQKCGSMPNITCTPCNNTNVSTPVKFSEVYAQQAAATDAKDAQATKN
ncbi:uncharacterized protein MONBRDRAFT_33718 [Monosiga brevicollis MX1]|uniref:Uncharacterized protein n=1 Tax=Monosiga brevicollis TaxID=81824 RepID=A9V726_MONBE|nr:uncharacterized protein MONBRDRAFT_33718 [Monosiga brevicollis MX1]EDQ86647.1 predicted protein [Monosiga brevicollis MX1]|eukprot:XP_001748483.1 hypothetical protein [Monosiga brevicollis MX1]